VVGSVRLLAVTKEIAARAGRLPGVKAFHYPASSITPVAFEILLPDDHRTDLAFGSGVTEYLLYGNLYVAKNHDQGAYERLYEFVSDSGPLSVMEAVNDTGPGSYASCSTVNVAGVDYGVFPIAGVSYLGARFEIQVTGEGKQG
jgi:hypothetical protein